ncbi:MAG: PspA/IM30 family protein, partial [Pseudomonadota bacterium]
MLATLKTIFIGESRRAEEAVRDHYALDLIAQKIREAEDGVAAAKATLAALIQRQRSETRQVEGLAKRIDTMTERAKAALEDGNDALAEEAAGAIATMENEK